MAAIDFLVPKKLSGIYNLVNNFDFTIGGLSDRIRNRQEIARITWNNTRAGYRLFNARVSNQKLKAAGYKLIHPTTII